VARNTQAGLDEGLASRSRVIREKIETQPKIRKWFQGLTGEVPKSRFDPEPHCARRSTNVKKSARVLAYDTTKVAVISGLCLVVRSILSLRMWWLDRGILLV
jgi:hypothetical protein